MKRIFLLTAAALLFFVSCEKKFPNKKELIGTWTEKTDNVIKTKLIFNDNTVYVFKPTTPISIDTSFSYSLGRWRGRRYLNIHFESGIQGESGYSGYDISFDKKNNELTIFSGGFLYFIEQKDDNIVFKKE